MSNIDTFPYEDLPENALALIASHLCIHDLRNFRLASTRLYQVSCYREVLLHLKVVAKKVDSKDALLFTELLEKLQWGRFLPVYILDDYLSKPIAENIAMNLKYVVEVSFDMRYTEYIHKYCPYVKKLTWINTLQNSNGQSDVLLLSQCLLLKNIERLEELIVEGTDVYFGYPRYPVSIIKCINENINSLRSLTFSRLHFARDESVPFDEFIINDTCIPNWKFHSVYLLGDYFLKLPNTLKSLECFYAEDIHWVNESSNLERIGLDCGSIPRDWSDINYRNMKHLTLSRIRFLTMYPPLCKHIRSLQLADCSHTLVYLKLLTSFTDTVEKLTLSSDRSKYKDMDDYRDFQIIQIVNTIMADLRVLVLENLHSVSPRFFREVNSSSLRKIIIKNCKMFSKENFTPLDVTYPFQVVIKNRCTCE